MRAATALRASGATRTCKIALLAPNILSTHVALWAAELAGVVFPINYLLGAEHVAELLNAADVEFAMVLADHAQLPIRSTLDAAIKRSGRTIKVFEIDANEEHPSPGSLQTLSRNTEPDYSLLDEIGPNTPAALFHTGGTTSAPKILQHLHANQIHVARFAPAFYALEAGDRMLNGFPLFHVAGAFVYGLSAFAVGATLYIPTMLGFRDPVFVEHAWQLFSHHRLTHLGCVPTTMAALLQRVDQEALDAGCVQVVLTGGSPLPAQLADAMEKRTGIEVRNIFGMTECAGVVSIEPADQPRVAGSVGFPLPESEVRAMALGCDPDQGIDFCKAGETGVLCLKGPHVSPGYLDASLDAGTFTTDGWLISGDLGHVDPTGRIF